MPHRTPLRDNLHESVSAWFLGPRAENISILKDLVDQALESHASTRRSYAEKHGDPEFITPEIQASSIFQENKQILRREFTEAVDNLNRFSIPFFSPRYAGHMLMETSLPAIAGVVSTILCNPNNAAFELSPFTTIMEFSVGKQLCQMLGYETSQDDDQPSRPVAWGHLPSGGTLANLESMCPLKARNLKFYPLALRLAMEEGEALAFVADSFKVHPCAKPDELVLLRDLCTWDLLNLRVDEILGLADRLHEEYGISNSFLNAALDKFLAQTTTKDVVMAKSGIKQPPQCLFPSTRHYSWPKSASILGIGSDNCVNVPVDNEAHIDLKKLHQALEERLTRQQAVYAVVAVIGSTQEGSVDPLTGILAIREEFQARGMSFVIHADAAWGGYFATMIRDKPEGSGRYHTSAAPDAGFVPSTTLRAYTIRELHALRYTDSVTVDPHKSGYVPYSAGGLCYRDGRMRYLLTWSAPYLHDSFESMASYCLEGSKPGTSSMATHLHHKVIGLHKEGHGALLGQAALTCRRISAHWAAMSDATTDFIVVPFNRLVHDDDPERLEEEKQFIREGILGKENWEIIRNEKAMAELRAIGSDLNINILSCNFRINGGVNDDVEEANYLNKRIFDRLSVTSPNKSPSDHKFFMAATVFSPNEYGICLQNFKRRLGLETDSNLDLFVLRNVVMSPFLSGGDYLPKVVGAVQETIEEEVKNAVWRNTLTPQVHDFTMQGTDQLYLVYRPLFRKANGRFQLILTASLADERQWEDFLRLRTERRDMVFTLSTEQETTLSEILRKGSFSAVISGGDLEVRGIEVTNIRVVKQRPLDSKWRDPEYPLFAPFYLYGTAQQQHIDHMLLRAPNAQLSAEQVSLQLDRTIPDEELARGALLLLDRREATMQPFGAENQPSFFRQGARFNVTVYRDPYDALAHGPGLAFVDGATLLATGTVEFPSAVFVDVMTLNTEDFVGDGRNITDYTSTKAPREIRAHWNQLVKAQLGV
ncbi:PLP-dependent transferase [Gloeopeniophorella convolvens]|nr:PLP-dependent transferase [Gloeopeniophorella convolvens]